jgi:hypothetical protein
VAGLELENSKPGATAFIQYIDATPNPLCAILPLLADCENWGKYTLRKRHAKKINYSSVGNAWVDAFQDTDDRITAKNVFIK